MTIIPRVLPSASLQNAKGTIRQRNQGIKTLEKDAFKWLMDSFNAKVSQDIHPDIELDELQDRYLQAYNGVIARVKPKAAGPWGGGVGMEALGSKRSIAGFQVDLTLDKVGEDEHIFDLLNHNHTEVFFHENRHLNDYLMHPKMLARVSEYERIFHYNGEVGDKLDRFYTNNIYLCKEKGTSSRFSDKERRSNIRKAIKTVFKEQNLTSDQRIAVLQHWRMSVLTEINARKSSYRQNSDFIFATLGAFVESKHVKIEAPRCGVYDSMALPEEKRKKSFFDYCKRIFTNKSREAQRKFFYPEKLQIIESLLAQEIKLHRQEHSLAMKSSKKV